MHTANTIYKDNDEASKYHRILGKPCYYLDVDQTELEDGTMNQTLKEYTYINGNPKTVALIDFKYPGKSLSDKYSSIKYQIWSSENEYKTPLPFFIVLTYLTNVHPVKMYYVIPANIPARQYFDKCKFSNKGRWMSLRAFSKFQHALRNIPWTPNQIIDADNLKAVGLPAGMTLNDLSGEVMEYVLPTLDFSWLK
jgi:hypothetical protein